MQNHEFRVDLLLDKLRQELITMGIKTEKALTFAFDALLKHDTKKAELVMQGDNEIDNLENLIDSASLNILIRTQPVARDLRFIMTAIRMVQDLERIGDEAVSIASNTLLPEKINLKPVFEEIQNFTVLAGKQMDTALEAFNNSDSKLALNLLKKRKTSTDVSIKIYEKIIKNLQDEQLDANSAMHLILICRALDRVMRRCENIAEHTYFMQEGVSLKHEAC